MIARCLAILLGLLVVPGVCQQAYINICINVNAPPEWMPDVTRMLGDRLSRIPDIQLVRQVEDAQFEVRVDVTRIQDRGNQALGFSLAAVVLGRYDQQVMNLLVEMINAADSGRTVGELLRYVVAGNYFLAGFVHTHGPLDGFDAACDQIAANLIRNGVPAYREFERKVATATRSQRRALPVFR